MFAPVNLFASDSFPVAAWLKRTLPCLSCCMWKQSRGLKKIPENKSKIYHLSKTQGWTENVCLAFLFMVDTIKNPSVVLTGK